MKTKILAVLWIALFTGIAFSQTPSMVGLNPPIEKPFEMLVIGDSIMWGQGHKNETKFTYLVKDWLKTVKFSNRRTVNMFVNAHSGATVTENNENGVDPKAYFDGEINLSTPNINQQTRDAFDCYQQPTGSASCYQKRGVAGNDLSFYQGNPIQPQNVDLILMDGCINDMSGEKVFDLLYRRKKLKAAAQNFCGKEMIRLLNQVTESFPNAKIIVTGYYRLVSKDEKEVKGTDPTVVAQALASAFGDNRFTERAIAILKIWNSKPFKQFHLIRNIFAKRSAVWYKESAQFLENAVKTTNKSLLEKNPEKPIRVFYVNPGFQTANSYAAENTFLWKMIDETRTDDPLFEERKTICSDERLTHFKGFKHFICHRAGLFHPNRAGAAAYYRAIANKLKEIQF